MIGMQKEESNLLFCTEVEFLKGLKAMQIIFIDEFCEDFFNRLDRLMTHMVRFTRWRIRLEARGGHELMSHLKNRAKINVSYFDV